MAEIYQVQEGECAGDAPAMIRSNRNLAQLRRENLFDAPEG